MNSLNCERRHGHSLAATRHCGKYRFDARIPGNDAQLLINTLIAAVYVQQYNQQLWWIQITKYLPNICPTFVSLLIRIKGQKQFWASLDEQLKKLLCPTKCVKRFDQRFCSEGFMERHILTWLTGEETYHDPTINDSSPPLFVPNYPCHTQSVDREVKLIWEASRAVHETGFIRQRISSRSQIKTFSSKKDFSSYI